MKVVIVGGVAAGMSAASQIKRRVSSAEVIVFERSEHVSYGACGMPYNLEDPKRQMSDLVVVSAKTFREKRGLDVRLFHEVVEILSVEKKVKVKDIPKNLVFEESYDVLVLATGASPWKPPIVGIEQAGVHFLRSLDDGIFLKQALQEERPKRITVVGGGYIGLEMIDVLRVYSQELTLVEASDSIAFSYHPVVQESIRKTLSLHSVRVLEKTIVTSIEKKSSHWELQTDQGRLETDFVIVATGIRPNTQLAEKAGIQTGIAGAFVVNRKMETNVEGIYAAGDCAEAFHRLKGKNDYIPLGTTANKQGKLAGVNASGESVEFAGIIGSAGFQMMELQVTRTGLSLQEAQELGLQAFVSVSTQGDKAHIFVGGKDITTVLVVETGSGRLLGAQMVGEGTVAKRMDVFATAITAGMTLEDIESLDLTYAPPFAPVYDPILIAATVGIKDQKAQER